MVEAYNLTREGRLPRVVNGTVYNIYNDNIAVSMGGVTNMTIPLL